MSDLDERINDRAASPIEKIKAAQRRCQRGEHLYSEYVNSSIDTQLGYNDALRRNPIWDPEKITLALGFEPLKAACWAKKCFFCHKTVHCFIRESEEDLEFES